LTFVGKNKQMKVVSYSDVEQLVGKLFFLECTVPAGMWYEREQYSALTRSGIALDTKRV